MPHDFTENEMMVCDLSRSETVSGRKGESLLLGFRKKKSNIILRKGADV